MLAIFSCEKKETDEKASIYGKWVATDFMSVESVLYEKKDGFNPVIEFRSDGSYRLELDINSCQGDFTLSNSNSISLSASGCTKMCCDSEFSKKFTQILPQVESYHVENNKLKMEVSGWGWINLELHN
jgi:heat shock protein HslJ